MPNRKQIIVTYASLFLVLIIDAMGIGLVMPLLGPLFINRTSAFISAGIGLSVRDLLYGVTLAVFCVAMFFGAPFFGDLSDHIGRRKVLLICLFGTAFGLAVSAIGINANSVLLLIVGRAIAGFMSGSVSLAEAAIVDISPANRKTVNLSLISAASCVGFAIGPAIAGILIAPQFMPYFGYTLPFWVAAVLALLNGFCLLFTFRETFFPKPALRLHLTRGVDIFISAITNKAIGKLVLIYLFAESGWALYFQVMPLYLMNKHNYDALHISYLMSWMGVIFAISLLLIIRLAAKLLTAKKIAFFACLTTSAGVLLAMINNLTVLWLSVIPASIGGALFYVALLTLFSDTVGKDKQGWVMGVFAAVAAISWSLGGVACGVLGGFGVLSGFGVMLPLFIGALLLIFGAIMISRV